MYFLFWDYSAMNTTALLFILNQDIKIWLMAVKMKCYFKSLWIMSMKHKLIVMVLWGLISILLHIQLQHTKVVVKIILLCLLVLLLMKVLVNWNHRKCCKMVVRFINLNTNTATKKRKKKSVGSSSIYLEKINPTLCMIILRHILYVFSHSCRWSCKKICFYCCKLNVNCLKFSIVCVCVCVCVGGGGNETI